MAADAILELADFAHGFVAAKMPESVEKAAADLTLDTLGCALAAIREAGIEELRAYSAEFATGRSPVWFSDQKTSPAAATLVNSSMAHALEYDDLHNELPIHSGIIVVPAALAVAAHRTDITGRELLASIVVGTEIICRIARATLSYKSTSGFRGWNPTAVAAGFATAAVAGRLLKLDAAGIARAMGFSYAQASGNQQCIEDGGVVKRMQPGLVAEAGVRAAFLAKAGITGAIKALEGKNGFFALYEGGSYDRNALVADRERLEIENVCFKRYPVCGMAQPAMDCLQDLLNQLNRSTEDIGGVVIHGSKFVVDMVGRPYAPGHNPQVDAQFNLSYCAATILETGGFGLGDLTPEKALDKTRMKRAASIPVVLDPTLQGKWEARVEFRLKSGGAISATRKVAAWQDDRLMTRDDLLVKFDQAASLASADYPAERAKALAAAVLDLGRAATVTPLISLLSRG